MVSPRGPTHRTDNVLVTFTILGMQTTRDRLDQHVSSASEQIEQVAGSNLQDPIKKNLQDCSTIWALRSSNTSSCRNQYSRVSNISRFFFAEKNRLRN